MMGERSDKDYAIEHGEYLAKASERFQQTINVAMRAIVEGDDIDHDSTNDAWSALSSAIHEFRKRAARSAVSTAPGIDYLTITRRCVESICHGPTS